MSRSSLMIAASFLVLAACQPAADAPEELVADTPPVIEEASAEDAVVEVVETVETEIEDAVVETSDAVTDDDHDDHEHADHDEEEHDHHDEGEHDHDDHDHAGGEAHVHGLSDLAVSIDGSTLSVSLEGALANFDLDETIRELDDTTAYSDGTVTIVGGDCTRADANVSVRPIGDHGNLQVDLVYSCAAIDDVSAIDVIAFGAFAGFEEVNAVVLTETGQTASTLDGDNTRLDLN